MNALLKRKELLAGAGFVALGLVVALAGLLLVVLPQRSKTHDLQNQIDAAQAKLLSLHGGSRVPVIKAADLFQLARAMPTQPDIPGVILDLNRAAGRTKVTIAALTVSKPVAQTDGAQALPMRLVVDGDWSSISAFLHVLRTQVRATKDKLTVNGRVFVIDTVQLSAASQSSALEATLGVSAFVYGETPLPAPTSTSTTTTTDSAGTTQAAGAAGSTG